MGKEINTGAKRWVENTFYRDPSIDITITGGIKLGDGLGRIAFDFISALTKSPLHIALAMGHLDITGLPKDFITKYYALNTGAIGNQSFNTNWTTTAIPESFWRNSKQVFQYAMFEAEGALPKDWVERWEKYIGVIIVPDPWVKKVFEPLLPSHPIEVVPLPMQQTFKEQSPEDEVFTFGISSQFEERKNHGLVIEAFKKAFPKDKKVALSVHGRWGHTYPFLLDIANHDPRIEVICKEFTTVQYNQWWKKVDAYVLCSAGEGYSYTPREAILRGIPTILSDYSTHTTLVKTGGVIGVKSSGLIPAYKKIWNKVIGQHSTYDVAKLVEAMQQIYEEYTWWKSRTLLAKRYILANENEVVVTQSLLTVFDKYKL